MRTLYLLFEVSIPPSYEIKLDSRVLLARMTRDMLSRRRVGTLLFSTQAVLAGTSRLALVEYAGTPASIEKKRRKESRDRLAAPPKQSTTGVTFTRQPVLVFGSLVVCVVGGGGR